jgi:hypothetical protein
MTLDQVYSAAFKHLKFDGKLAKKLYACQIQYVNASRDHLEFFGSNLLGVHVVRFKDSDVARIFDALDVDLMHLTEQIRHVKDINQAYKVSSDTFNITMMYLIHRFLTSPVINDTQRHRAAYDCALLFFYRCMAALLSYYFRYPADPKVAQMAYAQLSQKFLIKQLGSWHRVMDYRAEELISADSIHLKALVGWNNDLGIVYAMNDSQGRIRDLIKNYYVVFDRVNRSGERIQSTSSTIIDVEGEETLREKTKSVEAYVGYIQSIVPERNSFIKHDLLTVVSKVNVNTSSRMLEATLGWISEHASQPAWHQVIDEFIQITVVHSMHLIADPSNEMSTRDYPTMLVNMKYLLLSTRSTDVDLERIRTLGTKIVEGSTTGHVSAALILATRTAVILYVILRTLTGRGAR